MEKLMTELEKWIKQFNDNSSAKEPLHLSIIDRFDSIYPFNKFEYIISHLLAEDIITLEDYLSIRQSYIKRNKYLYLFEITAPRKFGETWAQRHLNEIVPELEHPSAETDKNYTGQYDFWLDGIRIEVKASRAVKRGSDLTLVEKALASDSPFGFDMNFQQLKPACCDLFVWIGVWRDKIRYWVLSSHDVCYNKYYSTGQHWGNIGEGQLWIKESNIADFTPYEVNVHQILEIILKKGKASITKQ